VDALEIRPGILIPAADLSATFSRASGPGGQNVNKVASRVTLRFALETSAALSEEVKDRVRRLARRRLNQTGELIITSQRYRDQASNLDDCRDKLGELVRKALVPPRRRRPTAPTGAAIKRRLDTKTRQAAKKRHRQPIDPAGGED